MGDGEGHVTRLEILEGSFLQEDCLLTELLLPVIYDSRFNKTFEGLFRRGFVEKCNWVGKEVLEKNLL